MSIKFVVSNLDDVPEALQEFYEQDPETQEYVLQASGAVPKRKLDEFRSNNTKLMSQNEALITELEKAKARNEDIDALKKRLDEIGKTTGQQGQQQGKGQNEPVDRFSEQLHAMQEKINKMQSENEEKIKEAERRASEVAAERDSLILDRFIDETAAKMSVQPEAMEFVRMKAKQVFRLGDDKKPIAVDDDGIPIVDTDSGKQWSGDSWMQSFRSQHPFAFKGSTGSGATGGKYHNGNTVQYGQELTADQIDKIADGEITMVGT